MSATYKLISKLTLSSDSALITLSGIPQNYTDLLVRVSSRTTRESTVATNTIYFNGIATNLSYRSMWNYVPPVYSYEGVTDGALSFYVPGGHIASNVFGDAEIYINNYSKNINKSVNISASYSSNSTSDYTYSNLAGVGFYSNTNPITSITLSNRALDYAVYKAGTTVYLYGISAAADENSPGTFGIQATGGDVTISGGYKYHVFKSSGTFVVDEPGFVEAMVIAGGGAGGGSGYVDNGPGGGGAGGVVYANKLVGKGLYNVIVGSGGAPVTTGNGGGLPGFQSSFANLTAVGGGGGGGGGGDATVGGSGGGSSGGNPGFDTGDNSIAGQGNRGGYKSTPNQTGSGGGGGGGRGSVGANGVSTTGGAGGSGTSSYSSWGSATNTGVSGLFAGGGGGAGTGGVGAGGSGGGGAGQTASTPTGNPGTINTGGGGGASMRTGSNTKGPGGNGGSGIVIIRYPVS